MRACMCMSMRVHEYVLHSACVCLLCGVFVCVCAHLSLLCPCLNTCLCVHKCGRVFFTCAVQRGY